MEICVLWSTRVPRVEVGVPPACSKKIRGMDILSMSCWIAVLAVSTISGCAPISKYPAPPRVSGGALAQASIWAASARRNLEEKKASSTSLSALRIALGDNSQEAREIANVALGRFVESNFDGAELRKTDFNGPDGVHYQVRIATGPRDWNAALLSKLTPVRAARTRAAASLQWPGWGVPVIGKSQPNRTDQPFEPRLGYRLPVTVSADMRMRGDICETTIRFLNPEVTKSLDIGGKVRPVAGNLFVPNLATFRRGNPLILSLRWLFQVDRFTYPTRLIFMQPFDPNRIPVVLVHGLLSTPQMWGEVVNGLQEDPVIRKNFQFWAFFYPTGQPIPVSALDLRKALQSAESRYPIRRGLVLVGHSMGGIVSRAQASSSGGAALLNDVFGEDAPRVAERLPRAPLLRDTLIFERDKNVRRVVFVCVPHRGSNMALAGPAGFFASLIRLPNNIVGAVAEVSEVVTTMDLRRPPTSIAGLSPRSPFLRALNQRPIEIPHHTILGDRGRGDSPNSSDGVVPYSSAHLETAESELIVPAGHGAFRHPMAIAEMRRVLREQLVKAGGAEAARAPGKR